MKIARIKFDSKELYCVVRGNSLYRTDVGRDRMGIESFFMNEPIVGDKITEINDERVIWLPPLARPGKIICVGRNYLKHSEEQGMQQEKKPLLFTKYTTSMIGHMSNIIHPEHTSNLDYEVELAVIIGSNASKLGSEDPFDYIFGYAVANDLTARDVQKSEKQWTRGKAFDNSLPIGPYIISKDEITPTNQDIWLTVNGEKRQLSNTKMMIYDIPFLIHYISQEITLEAGDIILTGTPEGVGYYMQPKSVLQKGDTVSCGVTGIGELRFCII